MFRGTKQGFYCMDCGRKLPDREIICKQCLKKHEQRGERFQMTALDRMERQ